MGSRHVSFSWVSCSGSPATSIDLPRSANTQRADLVPLRRVLLLGSASGSDEKVNNRARRDPGGLPVVTRSVLMADRDRSAPFVSWVALGACVSAIFAASLWALKPPPLVAGDVAPDRFS